MSFRGRPGSRSRHGVERATLALRLLLCMVPYLFFATFAEGMHNHPLVPGASSHSASGQGVAVGADRGRLAPDADTDCIACDWDAGAITHLTWFRLPYLERPTWLEIATYRQAAGVLAECRSRSRGSPLV